ncbi:MAG TPA: hypothetical protein VN081_02310 [Dongiaceae bacterium]|nr:hypothetical protein [Dongiaceae bacterium]
MVIDIRRQVENFKTVDWLNAVRNVSSNEYRDRVPEATQANITDVVNSLWNVPNLRNQFIDGLINRIGMVIFRNLTWTNPLAKFKRGMLEYGETIEEIMAGLLEATSYDADRDELEKEIFGAMTPEVQVSYHHVDRRDRYKLTIKEPELRKAFLTSTGVSEFVTNLMSMLQNSDQVDEFLIMMRLFAEMDNADGFFIDHTADLSLSTAVEGDARYMLKRLRNWSNTLPFVSRLYNPAGMPTAISPDKLELFVTASADAAMDVDALAAAFNIGKAEFASRKTVIPDINGFNIPGVQAILTTRDFFVCADQRIETTSQFNPATLANNYWLHHWGVYSVSRFAPAIMFNADRPSTVISENETPVTSMGTVTVNTQSTVDDTWSAVTNVTRGKTYNVFANAVTTPAGGTNDAVIYTVTPNGNPLSSLSQFTYVNNYGDLHIGPDEHNNSLIVTAMSIDDPAVKGAVTVGVIGDLIEPWPNPKVIQDSNDNGLLEVTPSEPAFAANVITIPGDEGVQYKNGATNLTAGQEITVVNGAPVTITAVAKTGYEIVTGATTSWTFTYAA